MKNKNRKVKILYLITGLGTGGAEIVLSQLVKNLDKQQYNPVVVSIIPIGVVGKKIEKESIRVLSLGAKFKYNPLIFFKVISIIRKEKPIILHSFLFHANFLARIVGKFCKLPIVISSIRNEYFGGVLREKLLKWTDKFCDLTIIVSQKAAQRMLSLKIVPENKLKVIYNGIDLKRFLFQDKNNIREKLGIRENQKVLISVGRLFEQKGHPYLIEAIKILKKRHSNIILLILGEGEKRNNLENRIKSLDLEKNVSLISQKENIPDYLNASDIFVMSSIWEGLPNVILEAMACALPVVATNVGGVPEIIENNDNGFLVEPKNSEILAEKIDYVLSLSPEKKMRISQKARKTIEERFSLEKMIENYENLYERFLKEIK